jgi:DNA-binding transcriptional LysR family regulator
MEINLHRLEIFLCAARERSFSKAAVNLRISQPSISIQIKKLEDSLQVKLFERLGRQIYLTREGAAVLGHVTQLTDIISNLESDLKELKGIGRGQLSAGCSRVPSATLVPLGSGGVQRAVSSNGNLDQDRSSLRDRAMDSV